MMDASAQSLIRTIAERGPRQFAAWNAALFTAYVDRFGPLFQQPDTTSQTDGHNLFASFLTLVETGIGTGVLTTPVEAPPANFLEFCLRNRLPAELPHIEPRQGVQLLARWWNLAEGLAREPAWVQAYILARTSEFKLDVCPVEFLTGVLQPLFVPAPTPSWRGPFRVTLLSMRTADDEFLPGDQYLAAPSIIVIADRKRPVRLGVHLRIHDRNEILGSFGQTSPYPAPANVIVQWKPGELLVGEEPVPMPFLREPFRWTVVPSGFIVASSRDSQKLWIVEAFA